MELDGIMTVKELGLDPERPLGPVLEMTWTILKIPCFSKL